MMIGRRKGGGKDKHIYKAYRINYSNDETESEARG